MKNLIFITILNFFSLISFPQKTFYINSEDGNDSSIGTTPSSAWKTIEKINSFRFMPGDSILLKRGCSFKGELTLKQSGEKDNPITIADYGTGSPPVIKGGRYNIRVDKVNYIHLKNLNLQFAEGIGIYFSNSTGDVLENLMIDKAEKMGAFGGNVHDFIIMKCTLQNTRESHGLYFSGNSDNILIQKNILTFNGKSGIHFNCDAEARPISNVMVRDNKIYHNSMYGIMNTALKNSVIYNNLIYNNVGYGIQFQYDIHAGGNSTDSNKVINNTFYNNTGPSIFIGEKNSGNEIRNNIFHQGDKKMYLVSDNALGNIYSNNLYYGSVYLYLWGRNKKLYSSFKDWAALTGDKDSFGGSEGRYDPKFRNVAKFDFSLRIDSPAKRKGIDILISNKFYRIQSAKNPDIGANLEPFN